MDIRLLTAEDTLPWNLLLLADPSKEMIQEYTRKSKIFVMEDNRTIIAVCVLHSINKIKVEVKNLAVDKSYQNKGLGKQLLEYLCETSKEDGYKKILICTGNSSIGQLALYQKLGFEIVEIKKNHFVENYKEPIWENSIQCKHLIVLEKLV